MLIGDNWDIWQLPLKGKPTILSGNGRKEQIRYQSRYALGPAEKGIDLSKPQYFALYGEWTKKSGVGLLMPKQAGIQPLT